MVFEDLQPIITVKTSNLLTTGWERMGLESFQNLIPREFLFPLSSGFLEDPTCKAASILPKSELTQCE